MRRTKSKPKVTIAELEEKALKGEDITGHFSKGRMVSGFKTVERGAKSARHSVAKRVRRTK